METVEFFISEDHKDFQLLQALVELLQAHLTDLETAIQNENIAWAALIIGTILAVLGLILTLAGVGSPISLIGVAAIILGVIAILVGVGFGMQSIFSNKNEIEESIDEAWAVIWGDESTVSLSVLATIISASCSSYFSECIPISD